MNIELKLPDNFARLPDDVELVIFRLVQESLTNIHRHSGSKTAVIRVAREGDRISVEVQGQVKGISRERLADQSQGAGVGITRMRERIRQFSGELTIDSKSLGTTIRTTLLAKAPPAKEHGPRHLGSVKVVILSYVKAWGENRELGALLNRQDWSTRLTCRSSLQSRTMETIDPPLVAITPPSVLSATHTIAFCWMQHYFNAPIEEVITDCSLRGLTAGSFATGIQPDRSRVVPVG